MGEWPELSEKRDGPTIKALHLYSQVAGKVATAVLPWRNHGWQVTLHIGPRGFRTEPIHAAAGTFELEFDLVGHRFVMSSSDQGRAGFALEPMTVASFYERVLGLLSGAGHVIPIHSAPNEVDPAIPFMADRAARPYDRDSIERLRRALVSADRVLRLFRSAFLGKASPVHFFWGSFDLAVTRFSGRRAPLHPGGIPNLPDDVTREAYSHEVSSAGFWPAAPARRAIPSSIPMPIRHPMVSPTRGSSPKRPITTRRSANSSSPMKRFGPARNPMRYCLPSSKAAMPPQRISAAGTERRWNASAAGPVSPAPFNRPETGKARWSSAFR